MIPIIKAEECTGCASCAEVCPPQALTVEDGKVVLAEDLCEECGFCAAECPVGAISLPFPLSGK